MPVTPETTECGLGSSRIFPFSAWSGVVQSSAVLKYLTSICLSIPVALTLQHRASVKRFVSFQFLNLRESVGLHWTVDQPVARSLPSANTELKQTDIYALSGIRTHDPSVPERARPLRSAM
jgi:hypothetical protein